MSSNVEKTVPNVNTKKHNAAGMTAEESKALPKRQPRDNEKSALEALRAIYGAKPTDQAYAAYQDDAVFHDPVGVATGIGMIREQFNGLAKLFPKSLITSSDVLDAPMYTRGFLVDQTVAYHTKPDQQEPTKTVNSLLTIELGADGKIQRHTEEWDHRGEKDGSDGLLGWMSEMRKKATTNLSGMFVSQDPNKV